MNYCETCKYRDERGRCTNKKLDDDFFYSDEEAIDMLLYGYMEGGGFWVGKKFGCVHYEIGEI